MWLSKPERTSHGESLMSPKPSLGIFQCPNPNSHLFLSFFITQNHPSCFLLYSDFTTQRSNNLQALWNWVWVPKIDLHPQQQHWSLDYLSKTKGVSERLEALNDDLDSWEVRARDGQDEWLQKQILIAHWFSSMVGYLLGGSLKFLLLMILINW